MPPQFILFVPHIHLAILLHFLGTDPIGEVRRITNVTPRRMLSWIRSGQIPAWVIGKICDHLDEDLTFYQASLPMREWPSSIKFSQPSHFAIMEKTAGQFQVWLNRRFSIENAFIYSNVPDPDQQFEFEHVVCLVREFINQRLSS